MHASPPPARPLRARLAPLLVGAGLALSGCASAPRPRPVAPAASAAMVEAAAALRERGASALARAKQSAREAARLEPGWVAPARLLDQLAVDALEGPAVLAARREQLARGPDSAALEYLVGRLEGRDGLPRHERALALDPSLAWAQHALAWHARDAGDARRAAARERRALALARDAYERAYFADALAADLAASGRTDAALELLERALADEELGEAARAGLAARATGLALVHPEARRRLAARERALSLLREAPLSDAELVDLVARWRATSESEGDLLELEAALATRSEPVRDVLRAELLVDARPSPLALGLLERGLAARAREELSGGASADEALASGEALGGAERARTEQGGEGEPGALEPPRELGSAHEAESVSAAPLLRAARFAAGEPVRAVERWLASLPAGLRGADGLPRDARLARVVRAARALSGDTDAAERSGATEHEQDPLAREHELGAALLDAGWLREARAFAEGLAARDLGAALGLERRALAASAALREVARVLAPESALPLAPAAEASGASEADARSARGAARGFDERLAALAEPLARALVALDGAHAGPEPLLQPTPAALEALRAELVASPRLAYGPLGQLVQPGPFFGARDEALGYGERGARVPGLARAMDRLGRFALYGELAGGGGPDATVLRRVAVEERAGTHLGRPWAGVAVFVEGADLDGRATRGGSRIAGAALHEGYWVDVEAVREELASCEALRRRFLAGGSPAAERRVAHALETRGLAVDPGPEGFEPERPGSRARRERRASAHALGEGRRVRLAVLAERAGDAPGEKVLGRATLEELLALTALHEEGHLVDRSRFLPLGKDLFGLLAVLARTGPLPQRIMEELEERAQLVALCEAPEPRWVLAQVLDALEGGDGVHARAYRRLAEELVAELDRALAEDPRAYPALDPGRTLVHQLHHLAPRDVRRVALGLARRLGLVAG